MSEDQRNHLIDAFQDMMSPNDVRDLLTRCIDGIVANFPADAAPIEHDLSFLTHLLWIVKPVRDSY